MATVCELTIPVPVYIEKYLIKKYGHDQTLNRYTAIGVLIIQIASKRYMKPLPKSKRYDGAFVLALSETKFKDKAYNISKGKMQLLTELLISLFNEDMVESVKREVAMGEKNGKRALLDFLKYYDISENELKFESAYMQYRRKK